MLPLSPGLNQGGSLADHCMVSGLGIPVIPHLERSSSRHLVGIFKFTLDNNKTKIIRDNLLSQKKKLDLIAFSLAKGYIKKTIVICYRS